MRNAIESRLEPFGRVLKRYCGQWMRESFEHLSFVAFHVNLHEIRRSKSCDQSVERGYIHGLALIPFVSGRHAPGARQGGGKFRRKGRAVAGVADQKLRTSILGPNGFRNKREVRTWGEASLHAADILRLRLNRDHAG